MTHYPHADRAAGVVPWRQTFEAGGATLFFDHDGAHPLPPEPGRRAVWADRYCSTWGDGGVWDCHDVFLTDPGPPVRIAWQRVDAQGNPTGARFDAVIAPADRAMPPSTPGRRDRRSGFHIPSR